MFHIRDITHLRMVLTRTIMREWAHPAIEPTEQFPVGHKPDFQAYENADKTISAFVIRDSFAGDYKVTIEKIS